MYFYFYTNSQSIHLKIKTEEDIMAKNYFFVRNK